MGAAAPCCSAEGRTKCTAAQFKKGVEGDEWVVCHQPRVTVRVTELKTPKEATFTPKAFSLCDLSFRIMVEAEGTGDNLEALLTILHDPSADVLPVDNCELPVRVVVRNARGLRKEAWMSRSAPYCICEIPGKPDASFQTKVISNDLNPVWDHADEVYGYMPGDSLVFSVFDSDTGEVDDLLGKGTLTSDQVLSGYDGTITLFNDGKTRQSTLYVQVASPRGDARIPATLLADVTRHSGIQKVEASVKSVDSEKEALTDPLVVMLLGEAISSSVTRFVTFFDAGLEDDEIAVPKF